MKVFNLEKPKFEAHLESWSPRLKKENFLNSKYNLVYYGDLLWGINREDKINFENFEKNEITKISTKNPIFVGSSKEEIEYLILRQNEFKSKKIISFLNFKIFCLINYSDKIENVFNNCFRLKKKFQEKLIEYFPESPTLKSQKLNRVNLFSLKSNYPIMILSPAPSRSCNYRCEYCFNHDFQFSKNNSEMLKWSETIKTAVNKIKNPLYLSIGSAGEPLLQNIWLETVENIIDNNNILSIAFVSNLSVDPREKIKSFNPSKFGILATLHPTQFKNYSVELDNFINRVISLHSDGVSIAVNYVLIPEQINEFHKLKKIFDEKEIPMICNLLRGPYKNKSYPEAYSNKELDLAKSCQSQLPFIHDYQSFSKSPYGSRCVAGKWGFQMEYDGTILNCVYSRQKLGNIFDDKLLVYDESCFCDAKKCESQVMIGMMENVTKKFKMEQNMHTFKKRNNDGFHPLLD